ncbi:neutrophil collagenase-like [Haliotis rufescens]|uniref:neutrophil collagenase-like n=1 Tax=Haliotis rufescens TaxID=6454 RepID=UPI00201F505A|nr:neutrophil collagenase-like [Haliotis rufescens]
MDCSTLLLLTVGFCSTFVNTAPTFDSRHFDVDGFLQTYGFTMQLAKEIKSTAPQDSRKKAIKLFQKYYGLETTGLVDDATFELMTSSRCGVPDNPEILASYDDNTNTTKPLAYKLTGPKWKYSTIRWGISQFTSQLQRESQRKSLTDAFQRWQAVSDLKFVYSEDKPDIDIRFVSRDHGDGSAFDGRSNKMKGNVLAHAFPPGSGGLSGDAHFDNDELWTIDVDNKDWERKYLEKVAAHEFGHSLGLQHSNVDGALMSAYYSGVKRTYDLSDDDINAIQYLYGKPDGWFPTLGGFVPTRAPTVPTCNSLFQAVVWGTDRKAYGIYMDLAYAINDGRYAQGIPQRLQTVFPGAPVEVDFAFTMNQNRRTKTFMFMGPSVWRFTGYTLDRDYPKGFNVGQLPEPPISAVAVAENGLPSIFMFGRTKWWIWDETHYNVVRPKGLDFQGFWSHNPSKYPLVTKYTDGDVYFIHNDNHVRLNARTARSGYPKKGVPEWILQSCPNTATTASRTDYIGSIVCALLLLWTTIWRH